jgi:DNA-binding NarL/FixJ family response regulator
MSPSFSKLADQRPHSSRIRTLIVHKNRNVSAAISSWLERDPRVDVIATATDGIVGKRTALAQCPDLIVIELAAAYLSGFEMMELLKQHLPGTKIILVSAEPEPDRFAQAIVGRADAFVPGTELHYDCERQLNRLFPA